MRQIKDMEKYSQNMLANKYMKRCSTFLIISEIKLNVAQDSSVHLLIWLKLIAKLMMKKMQHLRQMCKIVQPWWKTRNLL